MTTSNEKYREARAIARGPYQSCPAGLMLFGESPSRVYNVRGYGVFVFPTAGVLTKADIVKQIADEIDQIERYGVPLNGAGGAGER